MISDFNLLPKSIAPALVGYLALCYVLGDVFAGRIADRVHVPACVAGQHAKAARANYGVNAEKRMARELLREVFKGMPGLRQLPGANVIERLSETRTNTPASGSALSRCQCLAVEARRETKFDHMIWVAMLRFHEPTGVRSFQGVMARIDSNGVCGKEL
jgi:hypothetical protein